MVNLNSELPLPPRKIVRTKSDFNTLITIGVISLVIFLWINARQFQQYRLVQRLSAEGTTTTGVITGKFKLSHTGWSTIYVLTAQYAAEGMTLKQKDYVDLSTYRSLDEGDKTVITFLPSSPRIFEVGSVTQVQVQDRRNGWMIYLGIFLLVDGLIIGGIIRDERRQAYLLRHGQVAMATVTAAWIKPKETKYTVSYSFEVDGNAYTGTDTMAATVAPMPEAGQPLTVLYAPPRPANNRPAVSMTDYEVAQWVA